MIEDPPSCDTDDQVPDALVNVVLSFNQHFTGQWMVSPPAGVVVFTCSNYKHTTSLLPVCVEHITQEICLFVRLFSRMHTTAGDRSAPGVQGLLLASAVYLSIHCRSLCTYSTTSYTLHYTPSSHNMHFRSRSEHSDGCTEGQSQQKSIQ